MTNRPKRSTPYGNFADLKKVSKVVKAQAKHAQEKRKTQQKLTIQAQAEKNIFRNHVADVTPLKPDNRTLLASLKPLPIPIERFKDNEKIAPSSFSDAFDVETLLDTDKALSYRQSGISLEVLRKLRRRHWRIQDELDLHGYCRDDAREALYTFLQNSCAGGLRCVRIIHGKGYGSPDRTPVLKAHALSWLMQSRNVLAYTQARAADGGAGALIVLLKASPLK